MPSDSILHLRVGTAIIEPVNEVRDLGITLDSNLTLRWNLVDLRPTCGSVDEEMNSDLANQETYYHRTRKTRPARNHAQGSAGSQ